MRILGVVCEYNPFHCGHAYHLAEARRLSGAEIVASNTVKAYIGHLSDAYLFEECRRYDVKGRSYFDYPNKYYCEDIGLRNARIGFRQQEMTHIMENVLYNELCMRGYSVDVGVVTFHTRNADGVSARVQREIDFVANEGSRRYYIQSAFAITDEEKRRQETASLKGTGDSFRKIVVVRDNIMPWHDENGILYMGLEEFLLDERAVDR